MTQKRRRTIKKNERNVNAVFIRAKCPKVILSPPKAERISVASAFVTQLLFYCTEILRSAQNDSK